MKIFFIDTNFNIILNASTANGAEFKIIDDLTTYNYDNGNSALDFTVQTKNIASANELKSLTCNTFILKENYIVPGSFDLYTTLSLSYDVFNKTLEVYAENAGLELLNTQVPKFENESSLSILQYATRFLPSGWTAKSDNVSINTTKALSWEGTSSLTERLISISNYFDATIYYTFGVDTHSISEKVVHFRKKRLNTENINAYLTYGKEISNITISKDNTNLTTCLIPTGASPEEVVEGQTQPPIDLKGFSYSYTDEKGDLYSVETSTGKLINQTQKLKYKNQLDSSGLIERPYSFDTLDKSVLAGQARAELQKLSYPEIKYKINITKINEDLRVGDLVHVYSMENNIDVKAIITKITQSFTNKTLTAEIEVE